MLPKIEVLALGGGSIINPDNKPRYYQVANAYGAALAEISGTINEITRCMKIGRRW